MGHVNTSLSEVISGARGEFDTIVSWMATSPENHGIAKTVKLPN